MGSGQLLSIVVRSDNLGLVFVGRLSLEQTPRKKSPNSNKKQQKSTKKPKKQPKRAKKTQFTKTPPNQSSSPEEIRTLVKGSRGPYA